MSTRIRITGASRQASTGLKAVHWRVEFEIFTDDREAYGSLGGVYQPGGSADFSNLVIKTPHDLPDWVCETSLRDTVAGYFAHQVIATMEQPDGLVSETLEVTDQIEDGYATDLLPWTYTGTTTLKVHEARQSPSTTSPAPARGPRRPSEPSFERPPVTIGPYVQRVLDGASWPATDEYPVHQGTADDSERLFAWADRHGRFDALLPRLQARPRERDATISEIRSAWFIESLGARVVSWEPAATNRPGEFEVQWPNSAVIFVEVKGPTWQSELSDADKRGPRKDQPRFINAECRSYDTRVEVRYAADKTMGKLDSNRPNLLVVADHLFVSPVKDLDPGDIAALLGNSKYTGLGGIMCLDANFLTQDSSAVDVRTLFGTNPRAIGTPWELPVAAADALAALNRVRV